MNRRLFFSVFERKAPSYANLQRSRLFSSLAESTEIARPVSGLTKQSVFGAVEAAHLLRRTTFGASKELITHVVSLGLDGAINKLLTDLPLPNPPQSSEEDNYANPTDSWVTKPNVDGKLNGARMNSLRAWWLGLMLPQNPTTAEGLNIRERMTLFWQGHFVTESVVVDDARLMYQYNNMLRKNALGNFRTLLEEVTVSPAMLRYLNGVTNSDSNPNENYGRELLELFSIGKGQQTDDPKGDYTYYNEGDVKAATRVLTGWRIQQLPDNTWQGYFDPGRHELRSKTFSARFGNLVIANEGPLEYKTLINMILIRSEEPLAAAKFICRRLYRYFVYYQIDQATEDSIIVPMAQTLAQNSYEVKPVLRQLLSSQHFYDVLNKGCLIKDPATFVIGVCKEFGKMGPPAIPDDQVYDSWGKLYEACAKMQMSLLDPPGVSGWAAYGQPSTYHEYWINSDTLYNRKEFTNRIIQGIDVNELVIQLDPIAFIERTLSPTEIQDPVVMIDKITELLITPVLPLTQEQKDTLLYQALLIGLSINAGYWTNEWLLYKAQGDKEEVLQMLRSFFKYLLSMPEYHLS